MKKSLKKIKKTRLFFIISVVTQIASYVAAGYLLYKKQKSAAGVFAAIGLLGTICSIALWKYDSDGIVPKKLKEKIKSKKKKAKVIEEEVAEFKELTEEEVNAILEGIDPDNYDDYEEEYNEALEELNKAAEKLSSDVAADDEKEEI